MLSLLPDDEISVPGLCSSWGLTLFCTAMITTPPHHRHRRHHHHRCHCPWHHHHNHYKRRRRRRRLIITHSAIRLGLLLHIGNLSEKRQASESCYTAASLVQKAISCYFVSLSLPLHCLSLIHLSVLAFPSLSHSPTPSPFPDLSHTALSPPTSLCLDFVPL